MSELRALTRGGSRDSALFSRRRVRRQLKEAAVDTPARGPARPQACRPRWGASSLQNYETQMSAV